MENKSNKHRNYEILNLIGYGLSKFNDAFISEFGFSTKSDFYNYCVEINVAETVGTVKNRMDLFDPFFPENGRNGWWQKGDTYIHRKVHIDSLFGKETVKGYVNMIKLYLQKSFAVEGLVARENPIIKSRFKQLQETGLEAELYFLNHFGTIEIFSGGEVEDARLFGDGYDFQINLSDSYYLAEIKGIRAKNGKFRLTANEYEKACEYKDRYVLTAVLNLDDIPIFCIVEDPIKNLNFKKVETVSKTQVQYHLVSNLC